MKKFLMMTFLFVCGGLFSAQQGNSTSAIDSLLAESHREQVKVDLKKAKVLALEAYEKSRAAHYSKGICRGALYIAQILFGEGKHKESLQYLDIAQQQDWYNEDASARAEVARIRGRIFCNMHIFSRGLHEFRKALQYAQDIGDTKDRRLAIAMAYENLIYIYDIQKNQDSMYYYLRKNQAFASKQNEADIYRNLVNLNTAFGIYYAEIKKLDSAAYYYRKSDQIAEKYKFPYISYNCRSWGDLEMERKNYDKALSLYKRALESVEKTGVEGERADIYDALATAYEAKGDPNRAQQYRLKALEYDRELSSDKVASSDYAVSQILKEEDTILKQKSRNFFLMLGIAAVLIAGLLYFYLRRKQKNNRKILKEKEEETRELKQKVNESFEELIQMAKDNNPEFLARFQEVYPAFRSKMLDLNPDLKPTELLLAAYTYLGFTTKDVAQYTFKAVKTIKNNKYNLRKRIDAPPQTDFMVWLRSYIDGDAED